MIKLSKYWSGIKKGESVDIILFSDVVKTDEHLYVLLIPESEVEELKKGVIGEWE